MVSRDRRDPIVLQKVRKQGIKFCHDSPKSKETRNKILARDNLIPTFDLLVIITVCLLKVGIKLFNYLMPEFSLIPKSCSLTFCSTFKFNLYLR